MKALTYYFAIFNILLIFGTSCKSIEKSVYNGDYSFAINKLEKKLTNLNHKKRDDYIVLLEQAYKKAMESDIEQLTNLSNNPFNYKTVLNKYTELQNRQAKLKRYLPLKIEKQNRNANFKMYNFSAEIIAYKSDAANKLYNIAQNKLNSNNKNAIRKAAEILKDVQTLNPNFKNISKLIYNSSELGKNYVLINVENQSGAFLPAQLNNELTNFTVNELNKQWLTYHKNQKPNLNYDYKVDLVLHEIFVLPSNTSKKIINQSKKVKDGWEYVLDKHGNVKKDSLGNDIKRDKLIMVNAKVGENLQQKQATIAGFIYITDLKNKQLIKKYPVSGNSVFENIFYDFVGDKRALSAAYKNKIKNTSPQPFPNEFQMLGDANQLFENTVKESLDSNSRLVLN